jgi:hypothetical protein
LGLKKGDLTMISFPEFVEKVDQIYYGQKISISNKKSNLRYGQVIMNVLFDAWFEKYTEINGSKLDCFYNEDIVDLVLSKIELDWPNSSSNIQDVLEAEKSFHMTIDEFLEKNPPLPYRPGTFYNEDMDAIEVHFKNESFFVQPLNEAIELYISHETDEVVGLNVLKIKKLLREKILPSLEKDKNEII